MGQWPIIPQRIVVVLARSPDNKKPLSGVFTHQDIGGALARDYTAL
jgi:dihydrofolate reductase